MSELFISSCLICGAIISIPIIVILIKSVVCCIFWKQTTGTVTSSYEFAKDVTFVNEGSAQTEIVVEKKAIIKCEIDGELKNFNTKFSYPNFIFNRFYSIGKKVRIAYKNNRKLRYVIYSELPARFCSALLFILPVLAGFMLLVLLVEKLIVN